MAKQRWKDLGYFPGNDHGVPTQAVCHWDASQELEGGRRLGVMRYWSAYAPAPIWSFAVVDDRTDETAAKGWAMMRIAEQMTQLVIRAPSSIN